MTKYYITFRSARLEWPWWLRWLKLRTGFQHAAVFWWCDSGKAWAWAEHDIGGVSVYAIDRYLSLPELASIMGCTGNVTVAYHAASRKDRLRIAGQLNCVTLVKSIIGLRSVAITPYRLYRALLKRGAYVVDMSLEEAESTQAQSG